MDVRSPTSQGGAVIRGILTGLTPLSLFATLGSITIVAMTLAHILTIGEAFLSQQLMLEAILGVGMLIAFGAWSAGCVWALRRARAWELAGATAQAVATLWLLGVSAVILLLPVILAILIPQHPAHPAP